MITHSRVGDYLDLVVVGNNKQQKQSVQPAAAARGRKNHDIEGKEDNGILNII